MMEWWDRGMMGSATPHATQHSTIRIFRRAAQPWDDRPDSFAFSGHSIPRPLGLCRSCHGERSIVIPAQSLISI
jgi:hypothetical protein